jgi:Asp-tRNA(Asn)/Glu-tRNA(Gln) amidotransferase B subunit
MTHLIKILIELVDNNKISVKDCAEIVIAIIKDNAEAEHNGISNKHIEPVSQEAVDALLKISKL